MVLDPKSSFQISTSSGVPIYRQIIDQVKIHIAAGRLKAEDFLPSVRQVAKELEVNPMTVSKAYSILEATGVLETVRGQGMRVKLTEGSKGDSKGPEEEVAPFIQEMILKAKQLSFNKDEILEAINKMWEGQ